MSNEAIVRVSLQIKKDNVDYQSRPNAFQADIVTASGPTPGEVTVTTSGVDISLTELSALGGLCKLTNLDLTNWVEYGTKAGSYFSPLGEIKPGETYIIRLSRNLVIGSLGTATHTFSFRANSASCKVLIEAFEP